MRFILPLLFLATIVPALAGDPTGYWARETAAGRAPPAEWWKGLRSSGNTGCCDTSDGEKVADVDWDTKRGEDGKVHYRVSLMGKWFDVSDDAVVTVPNLYGQAVVWPIYWQDGEGKWGVYYIRCFMPGAGG